MAVMMKAAGLLLLALFFAWLGLVVLPSVTRRFRPRTNIEVQDLRVLACVFGDDMSRDISIQSVQIMPYRMGQGDSYANMTIKVPAKVFQQIAERGDWIVANRGRSAEIPSWHVGVMPGICMTTKTAVLQNGYIDEVESLIAIDDRTSPALVVHLLSSGVWYQTPPPVRVRDKRDGEKGVE